MIGIGITTHNRYDIFSNTLKEWKKYLPKGCKLAIVDDASADPVKEATFRFDANVGIAIAKNKCLELLDDCEHIFLADDDCYPIDKDWWKPYTESKEPHLCYTFIRWKNGVEVGDSHLLYQDSLIQAFTHPRGCLLYLKHIVLETVGGMDTGYGKAMFEHVDYSNRIFNAGLTTFRYMDVPDSSKLIYSHDEYQAVATSIIRDDRRNLLVKNRELFNRSFQSTKYCPYKTTGEDLSKQNNVIITQFLTKQIDAQRGANWEAKLDVLAPLIKSLNGQKLVVLNDCFKQETKGNVSFVTVESSINPYFQRWIATYQYLRDNPQLDNVWCIDGSDVEMLKNPFIGIDPNNVYIGSETGILGCKWLMDNNKSQLIHNFILGNRNKQILNCGLIGGTRTNVMNLIHDMLGVWIDNKCRIGQYEMGLFNYVAYNNKWSKVISFGEHVNTQFKAYELDNTKAIWKHK